MGIEHFHLMSRGRGRSGHFPDKRRACQVTALRCDRAYNMMIIILMEPA
jgi:hypothetical protein